ncbi:MAG TPA: hypothetical protein VK922_01635 [Gemmatimonadaceae bacterium]|nr:hypothetical protein [Gemmatimonadaceae bacterium]
MLERLTFLLAVIGYAGLTLTAVLAATSRFPARLWRGVALVIVLHVLMVWAVRYDWRLGEATRNGVVGFLLFHGALALILASLFLREERARRLVWTAYAIVTLGALGAVFTYEVVAPYRIPVILLAIGGATALAWCAWVGRRRGRVRSAV